MIITHPTLAALRTSLRRTFADTYQSMQAESFYRQIAMTTTSSSASNTYGWLGDFPDLREWIGDRVVNDIKEDAYQIVNKLYEGTVGVARTAIEDDELGIYTPMIQGVATGAARHPDKLLAALMKAGESTLCYDGQNFFDTDHPVYANTDGTGAVTTVSNFDAGGAFGPAWYLIDARNAFRPFIFQEREKPEFDSLTRATDGEAVFMRDQFLYGARARHNVGFGFWQLAYKSYGDLTADSFKAARLAMEKVTADGGRPLGVMPTHIIVPSDYRSRVTSLFETMNNDAGASNDLYQAVTPIVVPWLNEA